MNRRILTSIIVLVAASVVSMSTSAATVTERYNNDSAITNLFLWSDDPSNMTFLSVDFVGKKLADWSVTSNTGTALAMGGSQVGAGKGKFDITFDYTVAPFTIQFAEVVFDTVTNVATVVSKGNITFSGKKLSKPVAQGLNALQRGDIANNFPAGATVVPVPASVYLLISALGFVTYTTRRRVAQESLAVA